MNKRREWFARIILSLLFAGLSTAILLGRQSGDQAILIRARMPENGGWSPAEISTVAGKPIHLRLTSDDVVHSFAVGQAEYPQVEIYPGKISEVTLTFEKPGKYTYYCTRWCGADHWRMRGTIDVYSGNASEVIEPINQPPLYQQLGLDIDAAHPARVTPQIRPGLTGGIPLLQQVPPRYLTEYYYRAHSPAEVWSDLKREPLGSELTNEQLWSLVAAIWELNTEPKSIQVGKALYAQNCAACHGESGGGDGVMANAEEQEFLPIEGIPKHTGTGPVAFADAGNMLGASPALLQGKIIRGGMGTGMPYWGPIFTDDQTWALVAYLWTFQFNYGLKENP